MQGMTGIATGSYTLTTTPTELCFTVSSAREQLKMHNGEPWRSLKQYAGMYAGVDAGVDFRYGCWCGCWCVWLLNVGEEGPLFTTPPPSFAPSIPFYLQVSGEAQRPLTRP